LSGGGSIRSLGGWDDVKKLRPTGQDRIKSDQRIIGESDFVDEILSKSKKDFIRKYRHKNQGITVGWVAGTQIENEKIRRTREA